MNNLRERLVCICCDKKLNTEIDDNLPVGGTLFKSHGHYGSMYDPPILDGERFIEINVCDDCLAKGVEKAVVRQGFTTKKVFIERETWNGL